MTLDELKIGESATVTYVGGSGSLRQHFLDMGLIPGSVVTLEKFAPMGDPMELRIHGYELTLRLDDAKKIGIDMTTKGVEDHTPIPPIKHHIHPGLGEGGKYHDKETEHPLSEGTQITFALAGNQNCGKTTLFNALTGSTAHVGNWPGVTVEKKEGAFKFHNHQFRSVDLPGIYSLTSYTMEEKLSRQYILEDEVDVIVDVADASSLT